MYAAMALTLSGVHRIHRSDVSEVREIRWGAWVAPGVGLARQASLHSNTASFTLKSGMNADADFVRARSAQQRLLFAAADL